MAGYKGCICPMNFFGPLSGVGVGAASEVGVKGEFEVIVRIYEAGKYEVTA